MRLLRSTDSEVLVDGGAIVVGSVLIVAASQHLIFMTIAIPLLFVVRTSLWWRLKPRDSGGRRSLLVELLFLSICTALGAFNDWNSVVGHRIYDYTVPCFLPELTSIPLWMLLFWGLILRFVTTFSAWSRLGATERSRNHVRISSKPRDLAWLRVLLILCLVIATRQSIYRMFLDPLWSWLPFATATGLFVILFGVDRQEARLYSITFVVGPLIEVLYIQAAELHRYHLGWFGGVPLWIVLWWGLAVLVWKDIGGRIRSWLHVKIARQ